MRHPKTRAKQLHLRTISHVYQQPLESCDRVFGIACHLLPHGMVRKRRETAHTPAMDALALGAGTSGSGAASVNPEAQMQYFTKFTEPN